MSAGRYENVDGHRVWTPAPVDASRPADSDQQRVGGAPLPDSLTALLHHPEVTVQSDEFRCAVVICLPSHLARALAPLHPNPLQVELAAGLIEAAEMDAAEYRLDLLREDAR